MNLVELPGFRLDVDIINIGSDKNRGNCDDGPKPHKKLQKQPGAIKALNKVILLV
jgi:hypothetical protein